MRNNKKGFTLIELLAVIAILAILVVLAVPAILRIFNESKDSALVTQAQSIYKSAEEQIVTDQMKGESMPITYCHSVDSNGSTTNGDSTLELSGTQAVSYKIVVSNVTTSDGKIVTGITSFVVTDGTKIIGKVAPAQTVLAISDIGLDDIKAIDKDGETTPGDALDDLPTCN